MNPGIQSPAVLGDLTDDQFANHLGGAGLGLRIGPFNALLRSNVSELLQPLYSLYRDHPLVDRREVFSFQVDFHIHRPFPRLYRREVRLLVDGRQPHENMPAAQCLPVFEWGVNLVVALRCHCFLMLHSAVLEKDGGALLLPAAPGHGKSTLCAALANSGWRLLSDEFGLLRPGTMDMIPVPRPMALKNESIEVIRQFAPDAHIGPVTYGTRKGDVAHVKPESSSVARQAESVRPSVIVFPRWAPGTPFTLQRITEGEGFMRLATNAFNYELHGEQGFRTVAGIVREVQCYRLAYSDLEEAVTNLTELMHFNAR